MTYSELEQELDDFLAESMRPDRPDEPDDLNDEYWRSAVEQLEMEFTDEYDATDIKTMMRLLAKSLSAYDKKTEQLSILATEVVDDSHRMIREFEQAASDRVESLKVEFQAMSATWPEEIRRDVAKNAAIARHAPTYLLRNKIISHWRDNIGADKSNEFAAEMLQKKFPEVAHRTIARYVAQAKKLPPAGTL